MKRFISALAAFAAFTAAVLSAAAVVYYFIKDKQMRSFSCDGDGR